MVTVPFAFDHKMPCQAGNPVGRIKENFRKARQKGKKFGQEITFKKKLLIISLAARILKINL